MINVFLGKSASGKDYLLKNAIKNGELKPVVTYTTRPIREGEIDGVDYHFVTKEEFLKMIEEKKLIEYRTYNTLFNNIPEVHYYGTPIFENDDNYGLILDIDGALSLLDFYEKDEVKVNFIHASDTTRLNRAKKRGSFTQKEWDRRLKDDEIKFSSNRIAELVKKMGKPVNLIYNNDNEQVNTIVD